jgi:glycosyltransferase involved in cell wall biosynthesis
VSWLERPLWALLRGVHNRADAGLTISTPVQSDLLRHGLRRVGLWRGAVDAGRFRPDRRSAAARQRLSGGEPERPLLLYVGRLAAEKQVELLRGLVETAPEVRLALVGDGPHRPALERHFAGTPTLFTGPLYGAELAAAYASADLFVFPSATETFGLVLLEAMASGLPVVAAAAGGVTDFVRPGEVGYLFAPGDGPGMARAVRTLLDDPDLRRRLAANARREAERWSWARSTMELRATYQRVLGARAAQLRPARAWAG